MAVIKVYTRINWLNKSESLTTPLGKTNLNKMDKAINLIDDEVVSMSAKIDEIDTTKVSADQLNNMVTDVSFNDKNGVISITKHNGTVLNIDTAMEKIAVNFEYNAQTQQLILTLENGDKQYIDMSALITQYEFKDTDTIAFSVDSDGRVSASIKSGSITKAMLSSEVMSAITLSENNAAASAQAAAQSATNAELDAKLSQSYSIGKSGIRDGEDTDNSKYYSEQAKKYADKASEIVGGDFIPNSAKGIAGGVATLDDNLAVSKAVADGEGNNIKETYATKEQLENHELDYDLLTSDGETLVTSDNDNLLVREDLHQDTSNFLTQDDIDSDLSDTSVHAVQNRAVAKALKKKVDVSKIANNFTTTKEGFVADARAIKTLNDNISLINDNLIASNNTDYAYIHTFEQGESGFVTLIPKQPRKECTWLLFDAFPTENSLTQGGSYTISLLNRAADTITIGGGKIAATRIDSTDTNGNGYTGKVKFAVHAWRKGMILCNTPFCIRFSDD